MAFEVGSAEIRLPYDDSEQIEIKPKSFASIWVKMSNKMHKSYFNIENRTKINDAFLIIKVHHIHLTI